MYAIFIIIIKNLKKNLNNLNLLLKENIFWLKFLAQKREINK